MMRQYFFRNFLIVLIVICNVGCDQISKSIVRQKVSPHENIEIIENFLTVTKVENTGAFLSLGNSLPYVIRFFLLSMLPILVILYGFYFLFTKTDLSKLLFWGLSFIIGGGIGNIIDRILYGSGYYFSKQQS